jgi:hypothetical protein
MLPGEGHPPSPCYCYPVVAAVAALSWASHFSRCCFDRFDKKKKKINVVLNEMYTVVVGFSGRSVWDSAVIISYSSLYVVCS